MDGGAAIGDRGYSRRPLRGESFDAAQPMPVDQSRRALQARSQ